MLLPFLVIRWRILCRLLQLATFTTLECPPNRVLSLLMPTRVPWTRRKIMVGLTLLAWLFTTRFLSGARFTEALIGPLETLVEVEVLPLTRRMTRPRFLVGPLTMFGIMEETHLREALRVLQWWTRHRLVTLPPSVQASVVPGSRKKKEELNMKTRGILGSRECTILVFPVLGLPRSGVSMVRLPIRPTAPLAMRVGPGKTELFRIMWRLMVMTLVLDSPGLHLLKKLSMCPRFRLRLRTGLLSLRPLLPHLRPQRLLIGLLTPLIRLEVRFLLDLRLISRHPTESELEPTIRMAPVTAGTSYRDRTPLRDMGHCRSDHLPSVIKQVP